MRVLGHTVAAVIATAATGIQVAKAQETDLDTSGRQLEEIQVFAQKKGRAESLQDVPGSIVAFNEDQLDAIIFQDLSDISYAIPNVAFEEVGTFPGVQNFTIRGQGINSSIPSVDPTVGTFVDGVYIGTTYGVVVDTWDLESIEVLRGPQGLLFGRNVTGGAVLLRSRRADPDGELEARARVFTTDANRTNASFAVGAPLIEGVLAGRLMLYYEDDDGYFENKNTNPTFPSPPVVYFTQNTRNRDLNQLETKLARPSFTWTPTSELELTLIGEFGQIKGDGAPWTVVDGTLGLLPPLGGTQPPGTRTGGINEFETTIDEYGETDLDWNQLTFEFNWDIWGGTLTNIAGWREVDAFAVADIDGQGLPLFTAPGDTEQDQWSNEIRFATTLMDDRWDLTVGLFYLDQDIKYREGRFIDQLNLVGLQNTVALGGDIDGETFGIFWNNDFRITDTVTINAGLRYSDESKDARIISGPAGGGGGACSDVINFNCQFDDLSGDWDNWIPKLGVQWQFVENAQAYAFFTQGYRAGGFNFRNAKPQVIPPGPTEQEEQNTYEVGVKSEWFDQRLRANVAIFTNDIQDIQREVNTGDPDVVVLQGTINAGDVTINGIEIETQAILTDNLNVYANVGYLDGEYDSKNPPWDGINPAPPGTVPWLGDDLPRLAPWSYSLGGSYDIPLQASGLLNVRADYGVRDSNAYDDANLNFFDRQKRLNASINWFSPDERWTVSLFGNNMLDEANYGNITSIANFYTAGPMLRGKEYGLRVEWQL